MAFTREPSASRASTIGEDSSMRRPTEDTMRSITRIRWSLSLKAIFARSSLPFRSIKTISGALTKMSEIVGSVSRSSSGPNPNSSCRTSSINCSRSVVESGSASVVKMSLAICATSARVCSGVNKFSFERSKRLMIERCNRALVSCKSGVVADVPAVLFGNPFVSASPVNFSRNDIRFYKKSKGKYQKAKVNSEAEPYL